MQKLMLVVPVFSLCPCVLVIAILWDIGRSNYLLCTMTINEHLNNVLNHTIFIILVIIYVNLLFSVAFENGHKICAFTLEQL